MADQLAVTDRELIAAATVGPWRECKDEVLVGNDWIPFQREADAILVARARTAWPEALDRIEQLEAEVHEWRFVRTVAERTISDDLREELVRTETELTRLQHLAQESEQRAEEAENELTETIAAKLEERAALIGDEIKFAAAFFGVEPHFAAKERAVLLGVAAEIRAGAWRTK
jgi:hypothetical protein